MLKRPTSHWLATSNDGLDTAPYAPTCLEDCTWYVGWTTLCNQIVRAASYTVPPHHLVQDFHDTCLGSPTLKCQFCNHFKYYSCDTTPIENKVKLCLLQTALRFPRNNPSLPLQHTPSWCIVIKHRDNLFFKFYTLISHLLQPQKKLTRVNSDELQDCILDFINMIITTQH